MHSSKGDVIALGGDRPPVNDAEQISRGCSVIMMTIIAGVPGEKP